MRLIYEGRLKHAKKMLEDLSECKEDFNKFTNSALEYLTVEYTQFHGDVDLPCGLLKERDDADSSAYLYPLMYLHTPTNTPTGNIKVFIQNLKGKDTNSKTIRAIANSVVKYPEGAELTISDEVREKDFSAIKMGSWKEEGSAILISEENVEFQMLPNFYLQGFKISRRGGVSSKDMGYPIVEYATHKGRNDVVATDIHIEDCGKKSEGYKFGEKIAEILPSASTAFYNKVKDDWIVVRDGYDWNKGNPIVLSEEEIVRRKAK